MTANKVLFLGFKTEKKPWKTEGGKVGQYKVLTFLT